MKGYLNKEYGKQVYDFNNPMLGKHFDHIITDDLNQKVKDYNDKTARHALAYGFNIDKQMLEDDLYKQFSTYLKEPKENKMEYLDPTNLSKKELISIVELMQGLIEGVFEDNAELEFRINTLIKQADCARSNEQFAKRNAETAGRVFEKVVEILADKLKESND